MTSSTEHVEQRRALGCAIASLRKRQHLSQEQLANIAGIDRSYMGRIERGEQSVSFDKILDICTALSVSPAHLLRNI
ncbi:helix-turn-helix domain-containing protein [uncultured Bifidobacterium sp.]|uniref:helix-turn-helix domain-containing protein n=1 Tax=uncultured Bifidobacterium sp. TaxID=165187 RepID=UPI002628746D|nr:helix-turn-helix transcriptional regulator [uncultured Bifidobacterium sp.]